VEACGGLPFRQVAEIEAQSQVRNIARRECREGKPQRKWIGEEEAKGRKNKRKTKQREKTWLKTERIMAHDQPHHPQNVLNLLKRIISRNCNVS
jgi:hypothetical protein